MRRQELDGFATGLFGQEAALDLPERAHPWPGGVKRNAGAYGGGLRSNDATKPAAGQDIQTAGRNLREMTKTVEHEMHAVKVSPFFEPCRASH